ncbi:serine palmitoyltransferase [Fistulina hepatica ATCC 64428]|uniref:serine C-palmitoyltransferase n=1 Tax=Fistulina hepatica ATCC 64428 TaxID=1128425 RepID=A0A0D7ABZ0_9AGAR|nr:serine palmitoyltransferase [Fistulina hepatica ATCC 64428]
MVNFVEQTLTTLETVFNHIPGSAVVVRYVRSSHQNDPGRTLLEVILLIFAIRTLLQSRTRADRTQGHFIEFSEKAREIDELVDEWVPEPLAQPLDSEEQLELATVPVISGPVLPKSKLASTGKTVTNLCSYNFAGLSGNEQIKRRAIETLRKYGLGSCGPANFYGTMDVHMNLENDISEFLGTEATIVYAQAFSTVSSVIPAFCKRGDIIVVDRSVNFSIQKGIQMSRSTVRWFDHNDLKSLETVLELVDKEYRKKKGPLTRRFIVTEGIFEQDGQMVDLPKLIELKLKYKYRLILDESYSFGIVGRTGRGLTELYNVPASKVDMIVGSVAFGLNSGGGFCAGSKFAVDHQRNNGAASVFSATAPPLLMTSASEAINILRSSPSILSTLQENVRAARAILDKVDCIYVPSHRASPMVHIFIRYPQDPATSTATWEWNTPEAIARDERILQDVVDEALAQGVMITRAKRLRGQEVVEARPSIRLVLTSGLTKKETEKAVGVVKAACVKIIGRRR